MPSNIGKNSPTESGNILIYILGAIFLLGILIITVKGSGTPGAGIDQETLMIRVSEIQSYGNELENAVNLVMQNGISEVDIRFAHPDAVSAYGDITNMPARQIFSRDGGGATYREPPSDIQTAATDWVFNAVNSVPQVGSASNELLALLPNVSENFCLEMNEVNGIDNPGDVPPVDADGLDVTSIFTGSYTGANIVGTAALNGTELEGCLRSGSMYHYYRVLMVR